MPSSNPVVNLIKTEPALISAAFQAALSAIVATGVPLTADQSGALLAAAGAALAVATAVYTRPFQVSALTGFLTAVFTVALAFGVKGIDPGLVAAVNGAVVSIAALVLRGHVTPVASLPKPPPAVPPVITPSPGPDPARM